MESDCCVRLKKNKANNTFYEAIGPKGLHDLSFKAGLETWCDLREISCYLKQANTALEVGAGYGRVLRYLLDHYSDMDIVAIERAENAYQYLKQQFENRVELLKVDIGNVFFSKARFDIVLWLWSGLADFSFDEQENVITKLAEGMTPGGYLIIDAMPETITPLDMEDNAQGAVYEQTINNCKICTYSPSLHDIKKYAKTAKLYIDNRIEYQTSTGRSRYLYVLKK